MFNHKIIIAIVFCSYYLLFVSTEICTLTREEDGSEIQWDNFAKQNISTFYKNAPVGGQVPGIIISSIKFLSVDNSNPPCNVKKYFNIVSPNDTYISVNVLDGFSEWDNDKLSDTSENCDLIMTFDISMCENINQGNPILKFVFIIHDVNLKPPIFNKESYPFKIPFPIGQGVSLTSAFSQDISTTDTDFTTKEVTYTIEGGSDDFELVPIPGSNKNFPVNLKTKKALNLQKQVVLRINAVDDGTFPGPLNSASTITIDPDFENSFPPAPEFTESLFTEPIDLSELKIGDQFNTSIKLKEEYEAVTLTTTPDDLCSPELIGTSVFLTLLKEVDPESVYQSLVLTATITNGFNSAQSSVVIIFDSTLIGDQTPGTGSTTDSTPETDSSEGSTISGIGSTTDSTPGTDSGEGSTTSGTDSGEGSTTPGTESTEGSTNGDPQPTKPPPHIEGDSEDDSYETATIILGVAVGVLLVLLGYGCYRFVYRKSKKIIPTSAGIGGSASNTQVAKSSIENEVKPPTKFKEEETTGGGLKVNQASEKTRKRSITFSENDVESRVNRENGLSEVESSGTETESKNQSRSGSLTTTNTEDIGGKEVEEEDQNNTAF